MVNYNVGFKETMVRKMIGPPEVSATALAAAVGVHQSTLSRWQREYGRFRTAGGQMNNTKRRPQNWSAEEKLQAILGYEKLDEEARGRYLRERGLYSVDIERWRKEVLGALVKNPKRKGDPKDRQSDPGTPAGAAAGATIYSLIESAKAAGLEPYRYLRTLFQRLPQFGDQPEPDQLRNLLPQNITIDPID